MSLGTIVLLSLGGLAAGGLAGLVGVGGGVIFTPVLFAVYGMVGVPSGVRTPLTVATGLFCTGLAAGMSALHHSRKGAVGVRTALEVGLASAVAVGLVSHFVVTQPWYGATIFQLLFALVLLVVVGRMVGDTLSQPEHENAQTEPLSVPQWGRRLGIGTAAGTVAATVGVGGGVVLVPAYSRLLRVPFHRSVGTSSATIVVIASLSVLAYAILGSGVAHRPPFALGYVDVGTGLLLALPAVVGARGGAALAHRVNTTVLRWSFAVLAVGVAARLVWNASGLG